MPEVWIVSLFGDTDWFVSFSLHDDNEDRQPDDRLLLFDPGAVLGHIDPDEDGIPSAWQVKLPANDNGFYSYEDINGDGIFDTSYNSKTKAHHALVNNTWRLVVEKPDGALRTTCTVDIDGEETAVQFKDGAWQPHIVQAPTPAAQ